MAVSSLTTMRVVLALGCSPWGKGPAPTQAKFRASSAKRIAPAQIGKTRRKDFNVTPPQRAKTILPHANRACPARQDKKETLTCLSEGLLVVAPSARPGP